MIVVPVSFGFMTVMALCVITGISILHLFGALTRPRYKPVSVGPKRQPAPLTKWHRAFALGVPTFVLFIIVAFTS